MDNQDLLSCLIDDEITQEQAAILADVTLWQDDVLEKLEAYQIIRDALAGNLPKCRLKNLRKDIGKKR